MKYKSENVDLLLEQINIEDVVGEFVELKKAGANYKGLCPFHKDNNPSFIVSPTKNICKCFVCGEGGNAINFYSKYKKISYGEAVEELAKKYNISIKSYFNNFSDENEDYYKIMETAKKFYEDEIFKNSSRDALEYLSNRKISPKLIKETGLGYAPNGWSALFEYLIKEGYKKEDILKLGLVKENEKGVYDSFRNRIMFPIYSISGRVIAFGGRSLEDSKDIPKYINSQETPIFTKGKNLYGFLQKGSNIKKKNYSMLMEGYMDVLSAQSYGFDVALAPLGTALTEEQATLLKRYTNNVILAFDMDTAGQMATERAIMILKTKGFNIRIITFENAKDPDEYLKKFGKESFLKIVKESLEAFDYLFVKYSKEYNLDDLMSKQGFLNRFKEFFQCIENELEKVLYIDKLSKSLEIDTEILKKILITENKIKIRNQPLIKKEESTKLAEKEIDSLEEMTIALSMLNDSYFSYLKDKKINSSLGIKIFQYLEFLDENKLNRKNIIRDIIEAINLTDSEEEKLAKISTLYLDELSNLEEKEKKLHDTFHSWFHMELKEAIKNRENFIKTTKLKQIEGKLKSSLTFNEVEELYLEFEKINNA